MIAKRVGADEAAESRRRDFDVSNAADDGMPDTPEDGTSHKTVDPQRSEARKRMQRKDPGKPGTMTSMMDP